MIKSDIDNKIHWKTTVLPLVTTVVLIFNVIFLVGHQKEWAPLAGYEIQSISNERFKSDGINILQIGDNVDTQAVKCTVGDTPVKVTGFVVWFSKNPSVVSIESGRGTGFRYPCSGPVEKTTFNLSNEPPQSVIDWTLEAKERTGEYPVWVITGTETPEREGEVGATSSWVTEEFKLVAPEDVELLKNR